MSNPRNISKWPAPGDGSSRRSMSPTSQASSHPNEWAPPSSLSTSYKIDFFYRASSRSRERSVLTPGQYPDAGHEAVEDPDDSEDDDLEIPGGPPHYARWRCNLTALSRNCNVSKREKLCQTKIARLTCARSYTLLPCETKFTSPYRGTWSRPYLDARIWSSTSLVALPHIRWADILMRRDRIV